MEGTQLLLPPAGKTPSGSIIKRRSPLPKKPGRIEGFGIYCQILCIIKQHPTPQTHRNHTAAPLTRQRDFHAPLPLRQ